MELRPILSDLKHAVLTRDVYRITANFFADDYIVEAECSDIEEHEYSWTFIFRATPTVEEFGRIEAFKLRFNRYQTFLARYETPRHVWQGYRLYFFVDITCKEID